MKKTLMTVGVTLALLVGAGGAQAIQFGEPDDGEHPFVGLMVASKQLEGENVPLWRCSGTLISAHRFLTAGHCVGVEPGAVPPFTGPVVPDHVEIWFDEGPIPTDPKYVSVVAGGTGCANPLVTGYPCDGDVGGDPHPLPGWNGFLTVPNTHDLGLVTLDQAMPGPYGVLAPARTLDPLATRRGLQDMSIEVVGYGLQGVKPVESAIRERLKATTQIVSLGSAYTDGFNVRVSSGPGKGNGPGGTCFGDSGGPLFWQGQIVAVNSFVLNLNCKGSGYGYRTDTAASLASINSFPA
jgi:Trypsin